MAMRAESLSHLLTAEELLGLEMPGKTIELVRGVLVVKEPPSTHHGRVAAKLTYLLADHVYRHDLGAVIQDAGFKIESGPDTVRAPDVSFVSRSRVGDIPSSGYAPFAPDLAAEIVSPGDRPGELLAKVAQWLDAGSKLVWIIDPLRQQARAFREDGELLIVPFEGRLDGAPVLPGFTCALAEVLR